MTVVPPLKVPNVKVFYDPAYLENKVKAKLMTSNKSLVIMYLRYKYQVSTLNGY